MKKLSLKQKKHQVRRAKYALIRRHWLNGRKKRSKGREQKKKEREFLIKASAPRDFNLDIENVDGVVKYINKVKAIGKSNKGVDLDLTGVENIGIGAISMLLSVMAELADKKIPLKGTKPHNLKARTVLERSGFMKFVRGTIAPENKDSKDTIFTGNKRTNHTEIIDAIHDSMMTVWGEKGRCPVLYGTMVEMIKNSCKHAFRSDYNVRWHFAVSHDKTNNRVKFSFVDNGIGVVSSHEGDNILKNIVGLFRDNADFIEGAYTEGIKSTTGLSWRGTGLPYIYETLDDNIIKNLVVITNDAYCNLHNEKKSILKNEFKGTYYYWEIDKDCKKHCFK